MDGRVIARVISRQEVSHRYQRLELCVYKYDRNCLYGMWAIGAARGPVFVPYKKMANGSDRAQPLYLCPKQALKTPKNLVLLPQILTKILKDKKPLEKRRINGDRISTNPRDVLQHTA